MSQVPLDQPTPQSAESGTLQTNNNNNTNATSLLSTSELQTEPITQLPQDNSDIIIQQEPLPYFNPTITTMSNDDDSDDNLFSPDIKPATPPSQEDQPPLDPQQQQDQQHDNPTPPLIYIPATYNVLKWHVKHEDGCVYYGDVNLVGHIVYTTARVSQHTLRPSLNGQPEHLIRFNDMTDALDCILPPSFFINQPPPSVGDVVKVYYRISTPKGFIPNNKKNTTTGGGGPRLYPEFNTFCHFVALEQIPTPTNGKPVPSTSLALHTMLTHHLAVCEEFYRTRCLSHESQQFLCDVDNPASVIAVTLQQYWDEVTIDQSTGDLFLFNKYNVTHRLFKIVCYISKFPELCTKPRCGSPTGICTGITFEDNTPYTRKLCLGEVAELIRVPRPLSPHTQQDQQPHPIRMVNQPPRSLNQLERLAPDMIVLTLEHMFSTTENNNHNNNTDSDEDDVPTWSSVSEPTAIFVLADSPPKDNEDELPPKSQRLLNAHEDEAVALDRLMTSQAHILVDRALRKMIGDISPDNIQDYILEQQQKQQQQQQNQNEKNLLMQANNNNQPNNDLPRTPTQQPFDLPAEDDDDDNQQPLPIHPPVNPQTGQRLRLYTYTEIICLITTLPPKQQRILLPLIPRLSPHIMPMTFNTLQNHLTATPQRPPTQSLIERKLHTLSQKYSDLFPSSSTAAQNIPSLISSLNGAEDSPVYLFSLPVADKLATCSCIVSHQYTVETRAPSNNVLDGGRRDRKANTQTVYRITFNDGTGDFTLSLTLGDFPNFIPPRVGDAVELYLRINYDDDIPTTLSNPRVNANSKENGKTKIWHPYDKDKLYNIEFYTLRFYTQNATDREQGILPHDHRIRVAQSSITMRNLNFNHLQTCSNFIVNYTLGDVASQLHFDQIDNPGFIIPLTQMQYWTHISVDERTGVVLLQGLYPVTNRLVGITSYAHSITKCTQNCGKRCNEVRLEDNTSWYNMVHINNAHPLYLTAQPQNNATVLQIGTLTSVRNAQGKYELARQPTAMYYLDDGGKNVNDILLKAHEIDSTRIAEHISTKFGIPDDLPLPELVSLAHPQITEKPIGIDQMIEQKEKEKQEKEKEKQEKEKQEKEKEKQEKEKQEKEKQEKNKLNNVKQQEKNNRSNNTMNDGSDDEDGNGNNNDNTQQEPQDLTISNNTSNATSTISTTDDGKSRYPRIRRQPEPIPPTSITLRNRDPNQSKTTNPNTTTSKEKQNSNNNNSQSNNMNDATDSDDEESNKQDGDDDNSNTTTTTTTVTTRSGSTTATRSVAAQKTIPKPKNPIVYIQKWKEKEKEQNLRHNPPQVGESIISSHGYVDVQRVAKRQKVEESNNSIDEISLYQQQRFALHSSEPLQSDTILPDGPQQTGVNIHAELSDVTQQINQGMTYVLSVALEQQQQLFVNHYKEHVVMQQELYAHLHRQYMASRIKYDQINIEFEKVQEQNKLLKEEFCRKEAENVALRRAIEEMQAKQAQDEKQEKLERRVKEKAAAAAALQQQQQQQQAQSSTTTTTTQQQDQQTKNNKENQNGNNNQQESQSKSNNNNNNIHKQSRIKTVFPDHTRGYQRTLTAKTQELNQQALQHRGAASLPLGLFAQLLVSQAIKPPQPIPIPTAINQTQKSSSQKDNKK